MSPLFSIKPEAVAIVDAADKPAILEQLSQIYAASYGLEVGVGGGIGGIGGSWAQLG